MRHAAHSRLAAAPRSPKAARALEGTQTPAAQQSLVDLTALGLTIGTRRTRPLRAPPRVRVRPRRDMGSPATAREPLAEGQLKLRPSLVEPPLGCGSADGPGAAGEDLSRGRRKLIGPPRGLRPIQRCDRRAHPGALRGLDGEVDYEGGVGGQPEVPPERCPADHGHSRPARKHVVDARGRPAAGQARGPCARKDVGPPGHSQGRLNPDLGQGQVEVSHDEGRHVA